MLDLSRIKLFEDTPRKPNELHISTLCYCPRKEFFSYFFKPAIQVLRDDVLAGKYIHRIIQDQLEQMGYKVEVEVSLDLKDNFKLVGRIDAANPDHIVEIKTVRELYSPVLIQWILQVNTYMHITGIKKAILLIVERQTGEIHQREIEYDSNKAEEVLNLAEEVIKAIKMKDFSHLPKCQDNWCKYCSFKMFCRKA